jgi:hypothetical protein
VNHSELSIGLRHRSASSAKHEQRHSCGVPRQDESRAPSGVPEKRAHRFRAPARVLQRACVSAGTASTRRCASRCSRSRPKGACRDAPARWARIGGRVLPRTTAARCGAARKAHALTCALRALRGAERSRFRRHGEARSAGVHRSLRGS